MENDGSDDGEHECSGLLCSESVVQLFFRSMAMTISFSKQAACGAAAHHTGPPDLQRLESFWLTVEIFLIDKLNGRSHHLFSRENYMYLKMKR